MSGLGEVEAAFDAFHALLQRVETVLHTDEITAQTSELIFQLGQPLYDVVQPGFQLAEALINAPKILQHRVFRLISHGDDPQVKRDASA